MGLAPVPKRPMQLQTIPVDTVASHSGASAPTPQTRTYLPTLCKDKTAPSPRPKLSINHPSNPNLTTQQPKPSKQNAQIQQLLHHHLIRDQFPGTYPLNPPGPPNTPSLPPTASLTNQGNHYCHRDYSSSSNASSSGGSQPSNNNSYHYSNSNGSYYYSNPDSSTYYNDGKGGATYTPPSKK